MWSALKVVVQYMDNVYQTPIQPSYCRVSLLWYMIAAGRMNVLLFKTFFHFWSLFSQWPARGLYKEGIVSWRFSCSLLYIGGRWHHIQSPPCHWTGLNPSTCATLNPLHPGQVTGSWWKSYINHAYILCMFPNPKSLPEIGIRLTFQLSIKTWDAH